MSISEFAAPRMVPLRIACVLVALFAAYIAAPLLPYSAGWENGPIENLQAIALFCGGLLAIYWRTQAADAQERQFWLMAIPFWFILCARELSWGAVFMQPLDISASMGPVFSSSQQLPYKAIVAPLAGLLLLGIVWVFIRSHQYETLQRIWRARCFPITEIVLFVIAMLVAAEAEDHGIGDIFASMAHPSRQVLEEASELIGYLCLLLAQWRVAYGFRHPNPTF